MIKKKFLMLYFLVSALLLSLLVGCATKIDLPNEYSNYDLNNKTDNVDNSTIYYSEGIDDNGFWDGIRANDYVNVDKYKALLIPNNVHKISDDVIQNEINDILAYYSASVQTLERSVVDGDNVNIDYVGSIDGVEFNGGSTNGDGTYVIIGETPYIDNFLEQLIGHMPNETIHVIVTFPDEYHEVTLQGKEAVFITTINYIVENVNTELNDDFVKTNLSIDNGWISVSEMNEGIRSKIQKQAIILYIEEYLSSEITIRPIPHQLVNYIERTMLEEYREIAKYNDMELEEFLINIIGVSKVNELIELNYERNMEIATYSLVIQAIAEKVGISIDKDDLDDFISKNFGVGSYSSLEERYGLPFLKQVTLTEKVIEYVVVNAVLE